jgi:predicted nucleic acid-binding protein
MCIIVDPPVFVPIFKPSDPEHNAFLPVRNWVVAGLGKFVMGGTKYKAELRAVKSVLQFLGELERRGKIVRRIDDEVDAEERVVMDIEKSADFDDPHLAALARLTGCKVICLRDPRAHRFLRQVKLYGGTKKRPKLYTRAKNSNLLCNSNMAPCCR